MLAVALLPVLGCGGDGPAGVPDLLGTWEWVETSGGIAGDSRVPRVEDPRITVRFDSGGVAEFRSDGEVAREQSYRLSNEVTIFSPDALPVLYFDDEDVGRAVRIEDAGATLILSDNVYDGFSLRYERVDD